MRRWKKAALAEFGVVWDKWKRFSETGNCNDGIDCRFCPLQDDDRCPTYGPRDMREVAKALDEDVRGYAMITKGQMLRMLDGYCDDDEFTFVVDGGKGELVYKDIIQLINGPDYTTEIYLGRLEERAHPSGRRS